MTGASNAPLVKIERGVMMDCVKNGCEPLHVDHGEVLRRDDGDRIPTRVNNHAVTYVERVVTYGPWEAK